MFFVGVGGLVGDLLGSLMVDLVLFFVGSLVLMGLFDVIIVIGVLIKGEMKYFEYIVESVLYGLMCVFLDIGVFVIFGVLIVLNDE